MSEKPPIVWFKEPLRVFWWCARERYTIKLWRDAGLPPDAWTADPTFSKYHFCNVFRADDRTSRVIRDWAGSSGDPWRAAVMGRLVNNPRTILAFARIGSPSPAQLVELGTSVGIQTNAYRLNTPLGLNKVAGLGVMAEAALPLAKEVRASATIQEALAILGRAPCLGGFVGYQIILDLVDLGWFPDAFDHDWAWPGPGAGRGVASLMGMETEKRSGKVGARTMWRWSDTDTIQRGMRSLLRMSRLTDNWPWPERPWTIHEVEFALCEYDKWKQKSSGRHVYGRRFRGPYEEKVA